MSVDSPRSNALETPEQPRDAEPTLPTSWQRFRAWVNTSTAAKWILIVGALVVLTIGVAFNRLTFWAFHIWPEMTMEQLTVVVGGNLAGTDQGLVRNAVWWVVPITLLAIGVLVALLVKSNQWRRISALGAGIGLLLALFTFGVAASRLNFVEWLRNQNTDSTFIAENYVDPRAVQLQFPEQPRNLVFIYLESTEVTFASPEIGGGMMQNIIGELEDYALLGESFSGYPGILNGAVMLPWATHTAGGMFAQTAGLPLTFPLEAVRSVADEEPFLPAIYNLGRILDDAGYEQALLIGTDAAFGARDVYFSRVGNYQLWDEMWAIEAEFEVDNSREFWGFNDQYLLDIAKVQSEYLASLGRPFNLTILTVDTHEPFGYVGEECPDNFGDYLQNAFYCSSTAVAEFLAWLEQQPFYENTTVVLSADHLARAASLQSDVPQDYERLQLTAFLNAAAEVEDFGNHRVYSAFDIFPTTLAAMGVTIPGERLALGTNLFSGVQTLLERFGFDHTDSELRMRSPFLTALQGDAALSEEEQLTWLSQTERWRMEFATYLPVNPETNTFTVRLDVDMLLSHPPEQPWFTESDIDEIWVASWSDPTQADLQWIPVTYRDESYVYFEIPILTEVPTACVFTIHIYRGTKEISGFVFPWTDRVPGPGCQAAAD